MKKKEIPVLLLTGYLGSGKTTLLNHILSNERGIKFAVIVNDIGEVNIDADLIQKGGIVGQKDDSLVALQNGCICCTLKMDLIEQIQDILKMGRFDYLVIEASGICEPEPIAQTICSIPRLGEAYTKYGTARLDCTATVVDALRLQDEFGCGDSLTKENIDDEDIENLIIQQIEFCNLILLNKVSEVKPSELKRIKEIIRVLQPSAEIIECDYAKVDLARLINTNLFNYERVAMSAGWIKGIEKPIEELEKEEAEAEEHEHHHHEHEHEHHHEHGEDCECEHCHGHHHHDDDDEHEHEHHHHHEHEHEHEHDHDCHHEHGECTCGHHHHHHHGEGEAEEYGIGTFVYYRRPAFDIHKFDKFIGTAWPKNVIRAKGICYFAHNRDMSFLFEQAGRQKQLSQSGLWYATAPEEDLKQLMALEPGLMRDWDEHYGDRMQKIVFIGQHLDKACREAITAALDACLEE